MNLDFDLTALAPLLNNYGLRKFIKDHALYLQDSTIQQLELGTALRLPSNAIKNYMAHPADNAKNFDMYNMILTMLDDDDANIFLKALDDSENSHIIRFIKKKLSSAPPPSPLNHPGNRDNPNVGLNQNENQVAAVSKSEAVNKSAAVIRHLENPNVDAKEFYRPMIMFVCDNTADLDVFKLELLSQRVVSQNELDECRGLTPMMALSKLYRIAGQRGKGRELIQALEGSNNQHIIDEMYRRLSD